MKQGSRFTTAFVFCVYISGFMGTGVALDTAWGKASFSHTLPALAWPFWVPAILIIPRLTEELKRASK